MKPSYLNHYEIIQTYKEDEFQKVFVGAENKSGQAVIINNIYIKEDNPIWNLVSRDYENMFNNVINFEKTDDGILVVTKMEEGLSLDEYLTDFNPTLAERINLFRQYLDNIKKYDPLPNNTKSVLVDKSQIILIDKKISFNELIIFDKDTFVTDDPGIVGDNIISVLQRLLSMPNIDYKDLSLYMNAVEFIDRLRKNHEEYNSIEKISDAFMSLNIGNLPEPDKRKKTAHSGDIIPAKKEASPIGQEILRKVDSRRGYPASIAIGATGIITAVLVGIFVFKSILPSAKDLDGDINLPSDNIIGISDPIEGEDPEDIIPADTDRIIEPNSNISYLSDDIERDYTSSKYSDFSFKISNIENKSHKITIDQGAIRAYSQLLMWVKSDTLDKFNITVEGYSDKNLSLKQSISHKPLNINGWELVQFTLNKNLNDHVNIIFDNIGGTVWVDKISIDIFK